MDGRDKPGHDGGLGHRPTAAANLAQLLRAAQKPGALHRILSEARAAQALPWNRSRADLYRTIVPQMTLSLPEEEAAQWRFDFEAEMERLEAA